MKTGALCLLTENLSQFTSTEDPAITSWLQSSPLGCRFLSVLQRYCALALSNQENTKEFSQEQKMLYFIFENCSQKSKDSLIIIIILC